MQSRNGGAPQSVYVVGVPGSGTVKIGTAERPLDRLRYGLQNPKDWTQIPASVDRRDLVVLYQQPGGRLVEKALHEHFADVWITGEWYDLGPNAVQRIRSAVSDLYARGRIDIGPAGLTDDIEDPRGRTRRSRSERVVVDHKAAARRLMAEVEASRTSHPVPLCSPRVLVY